MVNLPAKYVVDDRGRRTAVVLEVADYDKLMAYLEELEDAVAFDKALAEGGETIPFDQAAREIEDGHIPG